MKTKIDESHPLIRKTFDLNSKKLPSINEYKNYINTDNDWFSKEFDPDKLIITHLIRIRYVQQSFIILCDEFLKAMIKLCRQFKIVSEIASGIGFLSFWITKYGFDLKDTIDDKSWKHYKADDFLPYVKKTDAIDYVKSNADVKLFILSWPDMDNLALNVWKNMKSDQHLLYIGEQEGGCTANDDFFKRVEGKEVYNDCIKELYNSFISFQGIHDKPYLFKKS